LNFLALCKRMASESGTLDPATLVSVTDQTKRAGKVIGWVGDAYREIQQLQPRGWPWQMDRFTGGLTVAGQAAYTGVVLTGSARFRRFICDVERKDAGYYPFSAYLQADGVATEYPLLECLGGWGTFIARYMRGTPLSGKPLEYAINPQTGNLHLGPTPDDIYMINGEFVKTNQILRVAGDVPEMPGHDADADFQHGDGHMIIVWKGLMRLTEFDEGTFSLAAATTEFNRCLASLTGSEALPPITVQGSPIDAY
jgi:hypothetical protein